LDDHRIQQLIDQLKRWIAWVVFAKSVFIGAMIFSVELMTPT
jgi:hypothetical protein